MSPPPGNKSFRRSASKLHSAAQASQDGGISVMSKMKRSMTLLAGRPVSESGMTERSNRVRHHSLPPPFTFYLTQPPPPLLCFCAMHDSAGWAPWQLARHRVQHQGRSCSCATIMIAPPCPFVCVWLRVQASTYSASCVQNPFALCWRANLVVPPCLCTCTCT